MNRVNSLHARLKAFTRGFRGVPVERVDGHLTWSARVGAPRRREGRDEAADLPCSQLGRAAYSTT